MRPQFAGAAKRTSSSQSNNFQFESWDLLGKGGGGGEGEQGGEIKEGTQIQISKKEVLMKRHDRQIARCEIENVSGILEKKQLCKIVPYSSQVFCIRAVFLGDDVDYRLIISVMFVILRGGHLSA